MSKLQSTKQSGASALIDDFLKSIKEQRYTVKKLTGGTQSQTFLVNGEYVFKVASPAKLKAEYLFVNYYKNSKYSQKLVFYDKNNRFIVYNYIEGDTLSNYPNGKRLIKQVWKYIKGYQEYGEFGFGDINKPHATWQDFLVKMVDDSKFDLRGHVPKEQLLQLQQKLKNLNSSFTKTLLHGDLRVENFIFKNSLLVGIIDPYPMIGDPRFDILFFLVSTPEMVQNLKLHKIHKLIKLDRDSTKTLLELVVCVKLKRIIKYSNEPQNIEFYKNLWQEILNV